MLNGRQIILIDSLYSLQITAFHQPCQDLEWHIINNYENTFNTLAVHSYLFMNTSSTNYLDGLVLIEFISDI